MWLLNQLLNFLFDLAMLPFAGESPWPGLITASLLTAAVLIGLFCVTSNQQAILRARNKFLARTLELLLFQHDLRVSLTACGRILTANFVYLFQFLLPMAVGLIPLVLIFVQMEAWFDRRPFHVGESTVLTVQLDSQLPVVSTPVALRLPDTVRQDSPPVRSPIQNEIAWRLVTIRPGSGNIGVEVSSNRYDVKSGSEEKTLVVGRSVARVSSRRESKGVVAELFAPSESPLAKSSPVRRMEISYLRREVTIGLTEIPWVVAAVVLMMGFSLILGSIFGVRIA